MKLKSPNWPTNSLSKESESITSSFEISTSLGINSNIKPMLGTIRKINTRLIVVIMTNDFLSVR